MTDPDPLNHASAAAARPAWLAALGLGVGVLLLVAAVIAVVSHRQEVAQALNALRRPDPFQLALLLAAIVLNLVLSGLMAGALLSRYGRVGRLEMQALIATATLMNYLPLRAGLFGRVAYHRAVNRIAVLDTGKTVVQAAVITAIIALYLAGAVALAMLVSGAAAAMLGLLVMVPPIIALAAIIALRWRASIRGSAPRDAFVIATLVRYAEVIVWSVRYHAAFALLDAPIAPATALAFACISMIASMVPFSSNGLGLREWAIGAAAPLLTAYHLELGLTAELVNRAAELVVVTLAGLAGMAYLAWRRHRAASTIR